MVNDMLLKPINTEGECCECRLKVRIYVKKAVLDQRPKALIVESSTPACAAAVAAPIMKLCPVYRDWSRPIWANIFWTAVTNGSL